MGLICVPPGAKGDIISPRSEARARARRQRRRRRRSGATRGVTEWTESLNWAFIHYEWAVRPSAPACNSSPSLKWKKGKREPERQPREDSVTYFTDIDIGTIGKWLKTADMTSIWPKTANFLVYFGRNMHASSGKRWRDSSFHNWDADLLTSLFCLPKLASQCTVIVNVLADNIVFA